LEIKLPPLLQTSEYEAFMKKVSPHFAQELIRYWQSIIFPLQRFTDKVESSHLEANIHSEEMNPPHTCIKEPTGSISSVENLESEIMFYYQKLQEIEGAGISMEMEKFYLQRIQTLEDERFQAMADEKGSAWEEYYPVLKKSV
jgi:hypothetical protein